MKNFNHHFYYFTFIIFISCGSVSDYSNNTLNKSYYENKTIYFILNSNSKKEVTMSGMYGTTAFDDGYKLNIENSFKESIEELGTETKLKLKNIKNIDNLSNNEILVNVEISDILWHFGFSIATLKTKVTYKIQNIDKIYNTEGIRKSGGGSKSNNLKKSLKNANYKFLKEFEK
ncbi:MAG: hypothetical protein U0T80_09455 [Flavobacteriaceae bacterium]|jgi:hypothetical protein